MMLPYLQVQFKVLRLHLRAKQAEPCIVVTTLAVVMSLAVVMLRAKYEMLPYLHDVKIIIPIDGGLGKTAGAVQMNSRNIIYLHLKGNGLLTLATNTTNQLL